MCDGKWRVACRSMNIYVIIIISSSSIYLVMIMIESHVEHEHPAKIPKRDNRLKERGIIPTHTCTFIYIYIYIALEKRINKHNNQAHTRRNNDRQSRQQQQHDKDPFHPNHVSVYGGGRNRITIRPIICMVIYRH
jgi:hypothetical protein